MIDRRSMSRPPTAAIAVLVVASAFAWLLILRSARASHDLDDCAPADTSRTCGLPHASAQPGTQPADSVLRHVHYVRHEFHAEDEERDGSLLQLVYDIPYLGACGIFPPLPILNARLMGGGGDGGMGPGASWKPFSLTAEQYAALAAQIRSTSVTDLRGARYVERAFAFDSSFDQIGDEVEWMRSVCAKHRRPR
jgi:hypothetical protein